MRPLSIVSSYYNEPQFLEQLLPTWKHATRDFTWIIVDDGSQLDPAEETLRSFPKINANIRLLRIEEDYGFNSHGARNLGMLATRTNWNILVDMDRFYGAGLFRWYADREWDPEECYTFTDPRSTSGHWKGLHANTFLIDRERFWRTGGYDEELRGYHTGDELFHKQLQITGRESYADYQFRPLRDRWDWIEEDHLEANSYDPATGVMKHPPRSKWEPVYSMCIERINKRQFVQKPVINFPWREIIL